MTQPTATDTATGLLLIATMILVTLFEWSGLTPFSQLAMLTTVCTMALLALQVSWSRRLFLLIGLALVPLAVVRLPHWPDAIAAAMKSACFIVAFFTAQTTLRNAATSSAPIAECGRFLAEQPPGRRYLALTVGGSLFGTILMFGSISLLGSLAEASAMREANAEIREHRLRRMLTAIQRGFVATLPWSPLAFATAISTTLVPGATWAAAVLPCLVSGLLLAGVGWAIDTIFKPRLSAAPPARTPPDGRWSRKMRPLLLLLVIIVGLTLTLHLLTSVRTVGIVMAVVPVIAVLWLIEQAIAERRAAVWRHVAGRIRNYAVCELPRYRSELVLLAMAGFIGALGSSLSQPIVAAAGIDLSGLPTWTLLLGMFVLIPITGQFGMNPILSVSLFAPLLPAPEVMGISPAAVIVAITSGWALSGATSPFTASTLLIASLGKVSASHVGWRWNGLYTLTCVVCLSVWICLAAQIL